MNRRNYSLIAMLAAVLVGSFFCPEVKASLYNLTTQNGVYNIEVVQALVTLDNPRLKVAASVGDGSQPVKAWVFWDLNTGALPNPLDNNNLPIPIATGLPVPVIKIPAGQMVTVVFRNNLPAANTEGASIHWHGIELDNDSDGVSVTQDTVLPGQSYTYRFIAPRPGLFWFHSHMIPGNTLFGGMYGLLVVTDGCEGSLIPGTLPPSSAYPPPPNTTDSTFPIALSDTEWDTSIVDNLLQPNPTYGQVGRVDKFGGVYTGGAAGTWHDINSWIEDCGLTGQTGGQNNVCGAAQFPGETVLVNGSNPDTMQGLVTWNVVAGQTIRLQLFDEALTRNFDLFLLDKSGNQYNLVRIGGQGGLLNFARVEGGNPNDFGLNTGYVGGHISVSSGVRADAVACVPADTNLGPLTLWAFNNTANWPLQQNANLGANGRGNPANGYQIPPTEATNQANALKLPNSSLTNAQAPNVAANGKSYPIAFFNIVAPPPGFTPTPCIVSGKQIRTGAGPCPLTVPLTIPNPNPNGGLIAPPGPPPGQAPGANPPNPTITLANVNNLPSVDNLSLTRPAPPGTFLPNILDGNMGNGDFVNNFVNIPVNPANPVKNGISTDRYATVGSVLQLSVANTTGNGNPLAHPYHLHGFSMQPLTMNGKNFNYTEFLDTIDVYSGQTYTFAVQLDDRQKFCDSAAGGPVVIPGCLNPAAGGALGRWLFHCHIAAHGVLGMMGELVVVPNNVNPIMVQQPPDATTTGVDVLATAGQPSQIVADDFQWVNPGGPITNVVIWGSWSNDIVDPNTTFELKFWTDVPSANGPFSRPGWQAWEMMFPPGTYTNYGYTYVPGGEWFQVPGITNVPAGDTQVYQYGFPIPIASGFYPQVLNATNWLSVTAYPVNPNSFFGWKTTTLGSGWNDDSAWSPQTWGPPWSELFYLPPHPYGGVSMNQAFALYTVPSGVGPNTPALSPAGRPAVVVPTTSLSAVLSGGQITITWSGGGTLQSSASPSGPWNKVSDASDSPYTTPATAPQQFYRVLLSP